MLSRNVLLRIAVLWNICNSSLVYRWLSCQYLFIMQFGVFTCFIKYTWYIKIMMYTNIYSIVAHIIIIFISAAVVIKFAPIENENKPLNFEKRIRNQKISRFLIIILSIFACIMFFFMRNIAITIALTLLSVSMLMVVSLIKPKEMKKVNKISKMVCTKIAKAGRMAAVKAAGTTSAIGCHQPKEPKALQNLKK